MYSKGELYNAPPKRSRAQVGIATSTGNTLEASKGVTPLYSGHFRYVRIREVSLYHTHIQKQKQKKGKEMRREEVGGGGAVYLTHDHAGSKPLFIRMSDLSVNIGGIIISCDIRRIQ